MAARIVKVEPFDLVVFGGTGDLAYRKLFPALFHREMSDQFTDPTRLVGVSRRPFDREAYRASVKDALIKFGPAEAAPNPILERFLQRVDYVAIDAVGEVGWDRLQALLGYEEGARAYCLATGPDLFGAIARRIGEVGLATPRSHALLDVTFGKTFSAPSIERDGRAWNEERQ